MNKRLILGWVAATCLSGATLRAWTAEPNPSPSVAKDSRVFEMRTYYAHPGKMEALHARFRDHTTALFKKHGMTNVGYWVPDVKDGKPENRLIYLLSYPSQAAREKAWAGFRSDPAWVAARTASEANGPLVEKVESVYMSATDYSAMK